ncbi:NADP-dependent phosphogluconate dehydrogenase [Candidatus Woesearchaeota archaeon]|nr:NADP-dependent phosphogluconate dehydrogenase [Candidatus Woesearchaeota archaeon]
MKIGFIGLGRMGYNMVIRLANKGHDVVAYNRSPQKTKEVAEKGVEAAFTILELVEKLDEQKIVWLMLPEGEVTDQNMKEVLPLLKEGDVIINGANSFYENAEKHDAWCKEKGIIFFDCGVSGGVWGLENGYPLMIGGPKEHYHLVEPFMKSLSTEKGYKFFGPAGSGHFVKSVHNIVEYVYLQGIAEGMELLSKFKHKIDLDQATEGWQDSSVVRSWLIDLTTKALRRPDFNEIGTEIGSVTIGELQHTKEAVKGYAPAFDVAVKIRQSSGENFELGKRVISAVRNEFGGHAVEKK